VALHPLGPLSPDEFGQTAAALRATTVSPTAWRFASIELNEPSKQVVRAYTPGEPIRRQAFAVLWEGSCS
jgi:primary-amine oxidase